MKDRRLLIPDLGYPRGGGKINSTIHASRAMSACNLYESKHSRKKYEGGWKLRARREYIRYRCTIQRSVRVKLKQNTVMHSIQAATLIKSSIPILVEVATNICIFGAIQIFERLFPKCKFYEIGGC